MNYEYNIIHYKEAEGTVFLKKNLQEDEIFKYVNEKMN